ncbi:MULTISPECIES: hypothetical protein [unclassified Cyanobium]|uniref:glutaredoxin family protein n=1 Tax=unclassified Cyanobium TaxID=2627006 RepID=UPI0020CD6088|nr:MULTISPECIES: hypothetical protein [unclassified Cyanobium]MCP9778512.1 hypothetical protein [Cyanobium sp. Tous-M-B4]MCP9877263.1 hypothetical protein [Cyanobium sp. A2C-AMD]
MNVWDSLIINARRIALKKHGRSWIALLLACALFCETAWGRTATELRVFVSQSCPHCAAFRAYVPELQRRRPDLRITLISVDTDPAAQRDLVAISRQAKIWPPGVPTFAVGDRVLVGFGEPTSSGPELLAFLDGSAAAGPAGRTAVEAGPLGRLSVRRLGLPLFTLALGLLDGFNPCAMWVLLFLLSLLVHLRSRRRMALVAGTFVLVSGGVYFLFLAAWLNVFLAVGFATPIRVSLALLALLIGAINLRDSTTKEANYHISIPARAKPGIYSRIRAVLQSRSITGSLFGVAALAVVVNLVELLCTAGLPAIFTAVLAQQDLPPLVHYGYLGLYILGYIADDTLMVIVAVSALSSRKLSEKGGRLLKQVSGVVMLGLGLVLLVHPSWLFS